MPPAETPDPPHATLFADLPSTPPRAGTRVLVADDEAGFRSALERYLTKCGYEVTGVGSGDAALGALTRETFAVLLCDVRMPGLSGVEVVPRAIASDPDLAIIMISAVNESPPTAEALQHGAMDYMTKPVELVDVARAVERALARREQAMAQRRADRLMRAEVALRTEELERRTADLERERFALRSLTVSVAETLINAMETKDVYLRGHSQRVADLAASVAESMGLDADTVEHVRLAGRLHDVGKIGIREEVLNKPDRLTPAELAHVQDHVRISVGILSPLRHLGPALQYVHDHCERWDGSGYPRGRRGDSITIGGRILGAADTFDALTSRRAYRQSKTPAEALDQLAPAADSLFGPGVFPALRGVIDRGAALVFVEDVVA